MGSGVIRHVFLKDHCARDLEKNVLKEARWEGEWLIMKKCSCWSREEMRRPELERLPWGWRRKGQLSEPVKISPSTV